MILLRTQIFVYKDFSFIRVCQSINRLFIFSGPLIWETFILTHLRETVLLTLIREDKLRGTLSGLFVEGRYDGLGGAFVPGGTRSL